jgi:hypothetical protein
VELELDLPIVLSRAAHFRYSGEDSGVVGRVQGGDGDISSSRLGADVAPFAPIKNSTRVANHNTTHICLEHSIWKCRQYADHVLNPMRHFQESSGRAENVTNA